MTMKSTPTNEQIIKKRVFLYASIAFFGVLVGRLSAYLEDFFAGAAIRFEWLENSLMILFHCLFFLLFAASVFLHYKTKTYETAYQLVDNNDEEEVERLYNLLYRHMEWTTLALNLASISAFYQLFAGLPALLSENRGNLVMSLLPYLSIAMAIELQARHFRLVERVRQVRLSVFSTIEEIKTYVNSCDEGERQASLEQGFVTLFYLNQVVLPLLYALVFLVSLVSQTQQLLAYIIIVIIQAFINISQYRMIGRYFR